MNTAIMTYFITILTAGVIYGQTPDQIPPVPPEEQPEVLTRGPVNEAFAQPVNIEEKDGFIAPEAPPPEIEETPPEEAPVGEQFVWIPGYWAWDSDRYEYIWISGCWRAAPPEKYWVPGYWVEMEDGWRWVEGFWASVDNEEVEYLPAPPAVTHYEPPIVEIPDKIWVPPCWYWSYGRYTLRAGYWIDARENWVWVPSHYVWTPRGYVFVSGHWDYPFHRRGVLFAPLYFPRHTYRRAGFSHSLSIVVDIGNLEFSLFTRPKYRHYYFGDYHDSFYVGIGIFPRFECVTRYTWYDPIYLHDRWRNRKYNPSWHKHERNEYARRKADKKLRPPRTYRDMENRLQRLKKSQQKKFEVAAPIKKFIEKKKTVFKFGKYNKEDRERKTRHADNVFSSARKRSQNESPVNVRQDVRSTKKPVSVTEGRVSDVGESRQKKQETIKQKSKKNTVDTPEYVRKKNSGKSSVAVRKDTESTKEPISITKGRVSDVRGSQQKKTEKITTVKRPVEKKTAVPVSRQKKPETVKREPTKADNVPQYVRDKSTRKSPATVRNISRTEKKTIPQVERRVVQKPVVQKRPELKSRESQRSVQRTPARSYEVPNRNQKPAVTSNRQVKSSTVSRLNKEKPGNVTARPSKSVNEKKSSSSSKRMQSKSAEEEEKRTKARNGMQRHLQ